MIDIATQQGLKYFDNKGLQYRPAGELPFVWLPDDKRFIALTYAPTSTNAGYWLYDPDSRREDGLVPTRFHGSCQLYRRHAQFHRGLRQSGGPSVFSPDSQFVAGSIGIHVLPVWETKTGGAHTMLLTYGCKDRPIHFAMDTAGNYAWLSEGQDEMVIVVESDQGQQRSRPTNSRSRYGWKNDREKLRVSAEQGATPPATTSPSTSADGKWRCGTESSRTGRPSSPASGSARQR